MAHFEIGINKNNGIQTVFSSDTLVEVLQEWKRKGYQKPEYFIDVWDDINGTLEPLAEIELE